MNTLWLVSVLLASNGGMSVAVTDCANTTECQGLVAWVQEHTPSPPPGTKRQVSYKTREQLDAMLFAHRCDAPSTQVTGSNVTYTYDCFRL